MIGDKDSILFDMVFYYYYPGLRTIINTYLTLKKIKNLSIWAPLSDAYISIFQFIQKFVFDHNTCTVNWVPLMGKFDSH